MATEIMIVRVSMAQGEVARMAREGFGDFVKAVVDAEQGIMAIGGDLHADMEAVLREQCGSANERLWGINIYPAKSGSERIEFDSMINLKPASGNRSRGVEDAAVREGIERIVKALTPE